MATEQRTGFCLCGCGQRTPIAKVTNSARGNVAGQPTRYALGHSGRVHRDYQRKGYIERGNARLHRLRAEAALGRPLPLGAEVHHPDEDPWNPNARLVICNSLAHHRLLHARARIVRAGGNPNTDKICSSCKRVQPLSEFPPTNCATSRHEYMPYCRTCQRSEPFKAKQREMYARKRLAQQARLVDTDEQDSDTSD